MYKKLFIISLYLKVFLISAEEITPYKFKDYEELSNLSYEIPLSSRFAVKRDEEYAPKIVYYMSKPKDTDSYPIAILCGGSSTKDNITSIIHFHRYFLQEFLDLKIAVITLEQWGVDGNNINRDEFIAHYTRSQRLKDHQNVIDCLKSNPPKDWNGKLILLGVSEGGPIVKTLTELNQDTVQATINWCGAGDYSWREELWDFICNMKKDFPWWIKVYINLPTCFQFLTEFPKSRKEYDKIMDEILDNPVIDKKFLGMTYLYHADALMYPNVNYQKIKTPFLVVAGAMDPIIDSCNIFIQKAKEAGMKITYILVQDMDHYVRKRPDIIDQSFEWLKYQLKNN